MERHLYVLPTKAVYDAAMEKQIEVYEQTNSIESYSTQGPIGFINTNCGLELKFINLGLELDDDLFHGQRANHVDLEPVFDYLTGLKNRLHQHAFCCVQAK